MAAAMLIVARKKMEAKANGGVEEDETVEDQLKNEKQAAVDRMKRMLAELDENGDGQISGKELLAWKEEEGAVSFLPYRKRVKRFYSSAPIQTLSSFVIVFSFLLNIVQKEIDPYPEEYQRHRAVWRVIDQSATSFFIIELAVNLYGSFIRPFVRNPWNWLDTVVVLAGIASLTDTEGLSGVNIIRVVRTFRVMRLFKRLTALRKIINALVNAVPGVLNALFVVLIFMSIYAIVAVDLFRLSGKNGQFQTSQLYGVSDAQYGDSCGADAQDCVSGTKLGGFFENSSAVTAVTMRGVYYGQEYYGTFSRSLYTLFQVGRTRMHFGLDIYVCVCVAPSSARCVQCSLYMLSLCSLRQDTRTRLLAHLTCTSYTCK